VVSLDQPGRGWAAVAEARGPPADLCDPAGNGGFAARLSRRAGALDQALHAAPPSTQNLAQCGWLSGTAPVALARLGPRFHNASYGSNVQATTLGPAAPLCFTTIREVAHITLSGDLPRIPQQAVVISGTSTEGSISGKIISPTGSSASIGIANSAKRARNPARIAASGSPDR